MTKRMNVYWLWAALFICFILCSSTAALANSKKITVKSVKILRPAYLKTHPDDANRIIRDSEFLTRNEVYVPAARQMVYFYDKDFGVDDFCGSYWTDLKGEIKNAVIYCEDNDSFPSGNYNPADIKAVVRAQSAKGFKIYDQLNILGDSLLVKWQIDNNFVLRQSNGAKVTRSSQTKYVDIGTWKIGGQSNDHLGHWAARLHENVDWTYGLLESAARHPIPPSDWVLQWLYGDALNVWDTIIINYGTGQFAHKMRAAAHELGHRIKNDMKYDNIFEYAADAIYLPHYHYLCSPVTETTTTSASRPYFFAEYEGHADATRSMVWYLNSGLRSEFLNGCAADYDNDNKKGTDIEGNIAAFYMWTIFGPPPGEGVPEDYMRPLSNMHMFQLVEIEGLENKVALRPLWHHFKTDEVSGDDGDSLEDIWDQALGAECAARVTSAGKQYSKYCGTDHFKDLVADELFNEDELFF
ncbi:MAG: hypothetical protein HQM16_08130 [Deltaproteobacteria bacterium]|nr:hypothetical protein [Deltaproteobacteria bacterium]